MVNDEFFVQVDDLCIDHSVSDNCWQCAIALALSFSNHCEKEFFVSFNYVSIDGIEYKCSSQLYQWQKNLLYNKSKVEPIKIRFHTKDNYNYVSIV